MVTGNIYCISYGTNLFKVEVLADHELNDLPPNAYVCFYKRVNNPVQKETIIHRLLFPNCTNQRENLFQTTEHYVKTLFALLDDDDFSKKQLKCQMKMCIFEWVFEWA